MTTNRPRRLYEHSALWDRIAGMTDADRREAELIEVLGFAPKFPSCRAECRHGPRPCPWVRCKWHTYLEESDKTGELWVNHPDKAPWELKHTCALDVLEKVPLGPDGIYEGLTLETVGALYNVSKERARQLESSTLDVLRAELEHRGVESAYVFEGEGDK